MHVRLTALAIAGTIRGGVSGRSGSSDARNYRSKRENLRKRQPDRQPAQQEEDLRDASRMGPNGGSRIRKDAEHIQRSISGSTCVAVENNVQPIC